MTAIELMPCWCMRCVTRFSRLAPSRSSMASGTPVKCSLEASGFAPDQKNGPYIHGVHLGVAARKIAERDGTHPGIRRKREIGSSAR